MSEGMLYLKWPLLRSNVMLAQYTFPLATFTATTVDAAVTAGAVTSAGGGLSVFEINNYTYATDPVLRDASGSTSAATAITNNAYFYFTVTGTFKPTKLEFLCARGGASTPRGIVVRSSYDSYAADLLSQAIDTTRATWSTITLDLTMNIVSALTVRIYIYTTGTNSSLEYDNITLYGDVP